MKSAYHAYSDVGVTTDVMTASNHQLIQLLIDQCIRHIESARTHIQNSDANQKRITITKALNIVDYLKSCLNHQNDSAQKLAALLDSLYAYMQKCLLLANINNDIISLEEAEKTLQNIKYGWDGIANQVE